MDAVQSPEVLRRLALIKYLFQTGYEQSKLPEPLGQLSILTFHDSVELFLHLSAETLNIRVRRDVGFMDYWDLINEKLADKKLAYDESMNRLNGARVAFKHHGTLPSKMEVEAFRALAESFFWDNTPLIFGISFDQISLIDLVSYEEVKKELSLAEELMKKESYLESQEHSKLAFELLIRKYEEKISDRWGRSPFRLIGHSDFRSSAYRNMGLDDLVDKIEKAFERVQEAFKVNALGIDYKHYLKFNMLAPVVIWFHGGKHRSYWPQDIPKMSKETSQYCINFVIESALTLQQVTIETS